MNATATPPANVTVSLPTPPFVPCNQSEIVQNPNFESEAVMREVISQCLCGESPDRMKDDVTFGAFVENCVYDKSQGPGAEVVAENTMKTCSAILSCQAENANSGLTVPISQNLSSTFSTDGLLKPVVTLFPEQILPGMGVTYQLKYTSRPVPSTLLAEWAQPRDFVFTMSGQESRLPADQLQKASSYGRKGNFTARSSADGSVSIASEASKISASEKIAQAFLTNTVPQLAASIRAGREPEVAAYIANGFTSDASLGITKNEARQICDRAGPKF